MSANAYIAKVDQTKTAATFVTSRRSFSLASHLALIAVLTALPLIVLAFFAADRVLQVERLTFRETLKSNARVLASAVNGEIDAHVAVARVLSNSLALKSGDIQAFQQQANDIRVYFPGSEILLTAPDGQQLMNTLASPDAPLPVRRNMDVMKRVLESRQPVISDVYIGRIAGIPMTSVEMPVLNGEAVAYVLSILMPAANMQQLLANQKYPAEWAVAVLDSQDNFVARIPDPARVGTPAAQGWREAIKQAPEGLIETISVEGDAVIIAFFPVVHGWTVGVAVRKSALDAPVQRTLLFLFGAAGASVALSFAMAWLVGRRLSSCADALIKTAGNLARGEIVQAKPTGVKDYDDLLQALETTSSLLKTRSQQRDNLEKSLMSSTALLSAAAEIAQIAPYQWDPQTDAVNADARFSSLWGVPADFRVTSKGLLAYVHPDDIALIRSKIIAALDASGDGLFDAEFRVTHEQSHEERWLVCRSRTIFAGRKAVNVIGAARDITSRKNGELILLAREQEFRDLANAMPQLVWTADENGSLTYYNKRRDDYYRSDEARMDWDGLIYPDDKVSTYEAWETAQTTSQPYEIEHRLMRADGLYAWHLSRAVPVLDARGHATKWYGTATDIDQSKRREEYVRVLMSETAHRSKNLIAVIQAVARQTAASSAGLKEFNEKFSARLQCLAGSHDLLIAREGAGVGLAELIQLQLGHFADLQGTRIAVMGDPILLEATAAQAIGMALHELATNAAKYGALSTETGKIDLQWTVQSTSAGAKLVIIWSETGGPPVVRPTRSGLGSLVIQRLAGDRINGTAELQFLPDGIVWTCEAALENVLAK